MRLARCIATLGLVTAALVGASPTPAETPDRKVVQSAGDLPRFAYRINGTATALVTAKDATFAPFAEKVRRDVDQVLADYSIKDHATLKRLLTVRLGLQILSGREDKAALETIEQIRDLEDKPEVKLLSGVVYRAVLQARAASGQTSGPAYEAAFSRAYAEDLKPLPWAVIGNRMKELKYGQEMLSSGAVLGGVQTDVEPALVAAHELSSDLAWGLIRQRVLLRISLPLKVQTLAAMNDYVAAHDVRKPDIWAARDVDLTANKDLTPVVVAIWDSGVDLSLFPGRVYVDQHPAPEADTHGLAFDLEGRRTHGALLSLDRREARGYAEALSDLKATADLISSMDSPEASDLKKRQAEMSPKESADFARRMLFYEIYSHGTHVAGITARGNPAIRLAVARITFDWHDVPIQPTEPLFRRLAADDAAYVAWFKTHGVRVVNISWNGTPEGVEKDLEVNGFGASAEARKAEARRLFAIRREALFAAMKDAPAILFVCSAGNTGASAVFSEDMPASFRLPNLLVVGATDQAGEEASFTSYGDTVRVDANGYQVESVLPGGAKVRYSGTSQAAPNVANLAAKLLAIDPRLKPSEVIQLIIDGATTSSDGRLHNINPKQSVDLLRARSVAALRQILSDYDVAFSRNDPISAGQRGDLAAAATWPDDSPAAVGRRLAETKAFKDRLDAVPAAALSGEDALNRELLEWRLSLEIEGAAFDDSRIPFSNDEGFFVTPAYAADGARLKTLAEARAWLARMAALPAYYDTEIANMRRGIATGFVSPRLVALTAARATRAQADLPETDNALLEPFSRLPPFMQGDRDALRAEALEIVKMRVKPAERALADFFEREYAPAARESLGASSLPNGRAYYAFRVRRETSTDMTPDEIFALGQSEIARIRKEMDAEIAASGFTGSFADFQTKLRTDPQFYVTSREALLEKASRLAKRVDDQLPAYFGKLPRLSYGVREVPRAIEDGYTSGRYFEGSPEQGVAGGLMINTSHLDQRPLYELPALVSHEGAPGHHIQIALGQEQTDAPLYRRQNDITSFVEGWALYSEQLTKEMGLYQTPYERFGLLSMEMWRACRLVMDVGIHWKGWTRDQAVACLKENSALSDKNIQNETDRYIGWPGQALAYKIGELRILALRDRARAVLGAKFDYRAFHDQVLDEGALPLSLLERRVNAWIDAQAR